MDYEAIKISQFLTDFQPLIHKTLQHLYISPAHMDYEDYFQELQIHLLTIRDHYEAPDLDIVEDEKRYMFTAYAKKGLYWHGLNLVKKNEKGVFQSMEAEDLEWLDHQQSSSAWQPQSNIYLEEFFYLAKKRLTEEEYLLLMYLSEEKYAAEEIGELFGVSRRTIYQRKETIQNKLAGIKNCLTS